MSDEMQKSIEDSQTLITSDRSTTMPRTATWHMVPPSDFETYRQVNNTKDIDNYSCHLFVAWSLAPHPADKKQQSARLSYLGCLTAEILIALYVKGAE